MLVMRWCEGGRLMCLLRFGWVNASYVYGHQMIGAHARNALGTMTPWDAFIAAVENDRQKTLDGLE